MAKSPDGKGIRVMPFENSYFKVIQSSQECREYQIICVGEKTT